MSTYKSTSGDYIITVADGTGTMYINGNVNVMGNVTYIETTDLKIDDPFITLAANNSGTIATAPYQQQGIVAQTSATTFAGLRFNNGSLSWEISANVAANGAPISAYQAIANTAAGTVGGPYTSIQFHDTGNVFGGNSNFTYDTTNSVVRLNGIQVFGNIGTTPSPASNAASVYNNVVGSGGTGLYVRSSTVNDELVSKSAAIVFAIIF